VLRDSNALGVRTLIFLLAGLLAAVGEAQEPARPDPATSPTSAQATKVVPSAERVIIKVGNAQITQTDFESGIGDIEPQADPDKEGAPDKDRRKLGDDYASVLMLSQQAVADHLDSSPEVSRQLAIGRMQILSDAEFKRLMDEAKPSFEEVRQYYSDHLADYDQVHIRRLFIWRQRDKSSTDAPSLSLQAVRARADQIRRACAAGTSEQKLSADLSKSGEGMLDPEPITFPRGAPSSHMEKVAFGLKEGEWGEVEETPATLLLVQLVKRDRQQLGEVSAVIEKQLQGQKMQTLMDDFKKRSGIWMDEQYFGTELRKSANKGESNNGEQQK
jgi:hypothetical protein